jgi:hypothetical protein
MSKLDLRKVREDHDKRHPRQGGGTTEVFSAEERHMLREVDAYKIINRRPHPALTDLLDLIRAMGYRLIAVPAPLLAPGKQINFELHSEWLDRKGRHILLAEARREETKRRAKPRQERTCQ